MIASEFNREINELVGVEFSSQTSSNTSQHLSKLLETKQDKGEIYSFSIFEVVGLSETSLFVDIQTNKEGPIETLYYKLY